MKKLLICLFSVLLYSNMSVISAQESKYFNISYSGISSKRIRDTILTMLCAVFTFAALNIKMSNHVKGRIFHPDCVIV